MTGFIIGGVIGIALGIIIMGILHDFSLDYPEEDSDEKKRN